MTDQFDKQDMDNTNTTFTTKSNGIGISHALDLLRNELKLLQEQDVLLLQQLMNIHFTIRMLRRGGGCRRFNSLAPSRTRNRSSSGAPGATPPSTRPSYHPVLSRVHSEPGRYGSMMCEGSPLVSMEEEDDAEDEYLARSFGSVDFEPEPHISGYLKLSLDLGGGTSELLDDMPLSLRRKYVNALTSHSPLILSDAEPNKRCIQRQNAFQHNSRSSSMDSDHGIEITAL